MKKEKISIVIPCYNSEKTIKNVVDDTVNTLKLRPCNYEIVLINDASKDNTWNELVYIAKKNKNVIAVNLSQNFGQHAATMAGFNISSKDIVITMDDDGQTDPKYIWDLVDKLNQGYDAVCAKYETIKESFFRRLGSSLNNKMAEYLLGKPKNIRGTSYRAIKKYIVDEIVKYDKSYPYIGGLIYRTTKNVAQVDVVHNERKIGKSGYSLKKLISLIMNGFTAFSIKPLRLSVYVGFISAFIGFAYGIIVICKKLMNSIVEIGYSSIISSILFIGGIIMILLGMIGEYVGRIYMSINNTPQYVVKEILNNSK